MRPKDQDGCICFASTWYLDLNHPGTREDTMGMQVPLDCGVPDHIIAKAFKLHLDLTSFKRIGFWSEQGIGNMAATAGLRDKTRGNRTEVSLLHLPSTQLNSA